MSEVWFGAAGLCLNKHGELLMVLQGRPDEIKTWSVPSGGKEKNETYEECCIREIREETGYIVEIIDQIKVKKDYFKETNRLVEAHYFSVNIVGGEEVIQDPDHLIYDIAWKSAQEIEHLKLTYPADRQFLIDYIEKNKVGISCK